MSAKRISLLVISSLIIIAVLVTIVNVSISLVLVEPEYNDFCDVVYDRFLPTPDNKTEIPERDTCYLDYDEARVSFDQTRFYVLAGIGLLLLLAGLFIPSDIVEYSALGTGGILLIEGMVLNFQNKMAVLITLLIILIIFGTFTWRKLKKL